MKARWKDWVPWTSAQAAVNRPTWVLQTLTLHEVKEKRLTCFKFYNSQYTEPKLELVFEKKFFFKKFYVH